MMQAAADEFKTFLEQEITFTSPGIPFISNRTGTWITPAQATSPQYWADHLRNTVQFDKGIQELVKDKDRLFLEVGPGRTLSSLLRMHPKRQKTHQAVPTLRHPKHAESDVTFILKTIGQLWLNGFKPDWDAFQKNDGGKRIPLPTYPFVREKHWFEPSQDQPLTSYIQSPRKDSSQGPGLLFTPTWKRVSSPLRKHPLSKSTWLLFLDKTPFSQLCLQVIKGQGHTILSVEAGEEFKEESSTSWVINPRERTHYDQVLKSIKQTGNLPGFILHAWNVASEPSPLQDLLQDDYEHRSQKGIFSLLYLSQALQQQEYVHPIALGVFTSNAHDVLGTESIQPLHATLHGPCRVIEKEIPNIQPIQIDLAFNGQNPTKSTIEHILTPITEHPKHGLLAFRGKHFWAPDFSPTQEDLSEASLSIQDNGVYVITGGLGGMGLSFATWLAKEYKATLLLLGRSSVPPKREWSALLSDEHTSTSLKHKIRSIQHLESLGAQVELVQADVTSLTEMQNVVRSTMKKYGSLHGVIHTAGVIEDTLLPLKDKESALRVLAPKIQGTQVLGQVLKNHPLHFLVLCSSINAYLSPAGQFDYTAANGFQDAFAYAFRQATGINTTSINWPGWKETGMLAEKKERFGNQVWFKKEFDRGITTQEGIEVLKQALKLGVPQLVVTKERIQLEREIDNPTSQTTSTVGEIPESGATSSSSQMSSLSANTMEEKLQYIWSQVLGLKGIGVHDDFFEVGGHSLLAVTLFKKMEQSLGALHLPISALIQAPTISKFAPLIKQQPETNTWSPLVLIQEGASKVPLFCVHGAGGNILIYRELAAQLGPQFTVYGLESQGLDGNQPFLSTISDMATQYVHEIQKIHPDGPYLLVGYCMGGTIALEMAQQLKSHGFEVPFLGLLETYNWINLRPETPLSKSRYLWQKIEFHTRNLLLLPSKERKLFWEDKLNTLKRRRKVWSGMRNNGTEAIEANQEQLHHTTLARIWKNNDDAALIYEPSFYDGHITHFRPQKEYDMYSRANMKFEELAREVETRILPVYPAGMMVPPFVSILADEIRSRIASSTQNRNAEKDSSKLAFK